MKLTSAKLTGNPDASGWTQVYDFEPQDTEKLEARGHLFVVISAVDSSVGHEIFARINEEYYGDLAFTAYDALKKALEKIVHEFGKNVDKLAISSGAILGDIVYLGGVGKGDWGFV